MSVLNKSRLSFSSRKKKENGSQKFNQQSQERRREPAKIKENDSNQMNSPVSTQRKSSACDSGVVVDIVASPVRRESPKTNSRSSLCSTPTSTKRGFLDESPTQDDLCFSSQYVVPLSQDSNKNHSDVTWKWGSPNSSIEYKSFKPQSKQLLKTKYEHKYSKPISRKKPDTEPRGFYKFQQELAKVEKFFASNKDTSNYLELFESGEIFNTCPVSKEIRIENALQEDTLNAECFNHEESIDKLNENLDKPTSKLEELKTNKNSDSLLNVALMDDSDHDLLLCTQLVEQAIEESSKCNKIIKNGELIMPNNINTNPSTNSNKQNALFDDSIDDCLANFPLDEIIKQMSQESTKSGNATTTQNTNFLRYNSLPVQPKSCQSGLMATFGFMRNNSVDRLLNSSPETISSDFGSASSSSLKNQNGIAWSSSSSDESNSIPKEKNKTLSKLQAKQTAEIEMRRLEALKRLRSKQKAYKM